jgi:murein L,D-transpeptidase YafK
MVSCVTRWASSRWSSVASRRAALAALASLAGLLSAGVAAPPAAAVTIEIDDVASDRVERQRAFAEGALPLPGTPDLGQLGDRLKAKGLAAGQQMFIRIFKAESELEVWMKKGDQFVLFDTYPICHWAGTIGPKLKEGDKQNPEGFYSVGYRQLHRIGRWPRSLNLGYPNTFDRAYGRTGSYILVHGGCSSVGCFAMTNAVMAEIFALTEQSLKGGQPRVDVHVFPFRMTAANLEQHAKSPWIDFWRNLREGYDAFEETKLPPRVGICDRRYVVETQRPGEVGVEGPLALCGVSRAALVEPSSQSLAPLQAAQLPLSRTTSTVPSSTARSQEPSPTPALGLSPGVHLPIERSEFSGRALPPVPPLSAQVALLPPRVMRPRNPKSGPAGGPLQAHLAAAGLLAAAAPTPPPCNLGLASCRKFLALRNSREVRTAGARTRVDRTAGLQMANALGRLTAGPNATRKAAAAR